MCLKRVQEVLRHTEVFSLAGHKLPGQLNCDIFGRMPALRILNLDGVEFGDRGIEQELPSLAHLTWRYGRAARFPFALEAIKSAGVLIMRGVTCLQPLLDGLQVQAMLGFSEYAYGQLTCSTLYCALASMPLKTRPRRMKVTLQLRFCCRIQSCPEIGSALYKLQHNLIFGSR